MFHPLITFKWLNSCSLYIEIPRPRIIQLPWISYYVGFWICYVSLSWWDQKCYAPLLRPIHSHVIPVKHPFQLYIDSMTKAFVNHVVMKLTVMYLIMISLKQPHTQTAYPEVASEWCHFKFGGRGRYAQEDRHKLFHRLCEQFPEVRPSWSNFKFRG